MFTLWDRHCCSVHIIEEETEAQKKRFSDLGELVGDFGSLTAECFILRMNVCFLSRNLLEGIQGSGA